MGPVRRGLILAALPGPALAGEACSRLRPGWDGTPVSVWAEAAALFGSPMATGGLRAAAMTEGCIGSPMIFILAAGAICVAVVLLSGRPARQA